MLLAHAGLIRLAMLASLRLPLPHELEALQIFQLTPPRSSTALIPTPAVSPEASGIAWTHPR